MRLSRDLSWLLGVLALIAFAFGWTRVTRGQAEWTEDARAAIQAAYGVENQAWTRRDAKGALAVKRADYVAIYKSGLRVTRQDQMRMAHHWFEDVVSAQAVTEILAITVKSIRADVKVRERYERRYSDARAEVFVTLSDDVWFLESGKWGKVSSTNYYEKLTVNGKPSVLP